MSEAITVGDHPHSDPGDGRSECQACGKWVWLVTHSCKGIPVTRVALDRRNSLASDRGADDHEPCDGPCCDQLDAIDAMNDLNNQPSTEGNPA